MALTLDSTLATAQDSIERRPIVELISTQIAAAIPFDGNYFNDYDETESNISLISGSTGQLFFIFIRDANIMFMYSDEDRESWTEVTLFNPAGTLDDISLVELDNGNLGIVFINHIGATYYLRQCIITPEGIISTPSNIIATYSSGEVLQGPYILKLSNGTFILTYVQLLSDVYSVQMRTAVNFGTWTSQSEITLTGLDTANEMDNTSLVQADNGNILLCLDYADDEREDGSQIKNIYLVVSENFGTTWETPVALTTYAEWGTYGEHPDLSKDSTGEIKLTFHETNNVLFADSDTPLWQAGLCSSQEGTNIHFDPSTNRLYVYQINSGVGTKYLCGIVVFNTETWSVVRNYNTTSSPAYNTVFANENVFWDRHKGAAHYVAVSTRDATHCATMLIDHNAESITEYYFKDSATYSFTKNVTGLDWRISQFESSGKVAATFIDENNLRLYVVLTYSNPFFQRILIGYFDIGGGFDFNEVYYSEEEFTSYQVDSLNAKFISELNSIVLYVVTPVTEGRLTLISVESGAITYDYTYTDYPGFPYFGVNYPVYYNGHIYGSFTYTTSFGQGDYRGMVDIDLSTNAIVYHRPSWASVNDYALTNKINLEDGRLLMCSEGYGVAIFSTTSYAWTLFNNDNVPGFETGNAPFPTDVAYDSVNDIIFVGSVRPTGYTSFSGIRAFSESGAFSKGKYNLGEYVGETLTWGTIADLIQSNYGSDVANTTDEEDVLWSVWIERDVTEYSLNWDSDNATLNLVPYIVAGSAVTVDYSIDSNNKLSFTLSNGHLFDPNNNLSSISQYARKGQLITLRFGERIGIVDYYHKQGSYVITSSKMSYSRGTYPTISINCEDKRTIWDEVKVVATDRYDNSDPEDILIDLLTTYVSLSESDYDIDTLNNSHGIYHQWIDENLMDIISELLDHFSYISFIDVDDIFTTKQITVDGSVDHDYTSLDKQIINFSPDDNYSSFTNRVTVKGESLEFLEVLYPEELIQAVSGTGGWWSDKDKQLKIYYSADHQRRCRDPRLSVVKSIKDFKILWEESGGDEYLSDIDTDEKWVEVTIEYPGITEVLITSITTLSAVGYQAATCDTSASCGGYLTTFSVLTAAVSWILGQVATYEYEIYAKPLGEEKQTIYADADDLEFQQTLNGQIVNEEIMDPFCYTIASCQTVADQELDIVKAQRKRVSFQKIAHLQDEICDRIQINHPYNNQILDIFITNLKRTFIKPKKGVSNSGTFTDDITGWII